MRENPLKRIVEIQKSGKAVGIYSCCSANRYVIEAAIAAGKRDNACVLIESTANQCDQYGGYTGMKPQDFMNFVLEVAKKQDFDTNKLFLGGDHLGPLTFASKNEEEAMKESEELIRCYVKAGFTKIHIDTSMKVASDDPNVRLSDEIIAGRGARLARVAEDTFHNVVLKENPDATHPVYIVGSEVPIPGGQQSGADEGMQVTKVADFKATVSTFEKAFKEHGWKFDFFVCNNGGVILDQDMNLIQLYLIDFDKAMEIYNFAQLYTPDSCTLNDGLRRATKQFVENAKDLHGSGSGSVSAEELLAQKKIAQIVMVFHEQSKADALGEALNQTFGDAITAYINVNCVDIVPKGVSKGNGFKALLNHMHLDETDAYGIGDANNDLPLIEMFHGASFDYSPIDVQKKSTYVVKTMEEFVYIVEKL